MIKGVLAYNEENDRYGLLRSDLWECEGFHCGEQLDVELPDGEWVSTRIEFDWNTKEWYLVNTPYRGDGLQYVRARICV